MLYRIRRMQEEFGIPLDEPVKHADLLLSVSLLLFEAKGPDFFLPKTSSENSYRGHAFGKILSQLSVRIS